MFSDQDGSAILVECNLGKQIPVPDLGVQA
jgi:hypothetical protein